jgi:hypothetical protein
VRVKPPNNEAGPILLSLAGSAVVAASWVATVSAFKVRFLEYLWTVNHRKWAYVR